VASEDGVAKALVLEFERGLLPASGRLLFLNALPLPGIDPASGDRLVCEQGFRPAFLDLQAARHAAEPFVDADAGDYSGAIVRAGRLRRSNEEMIARAFEAVTPGAPVIVAGGKTDGIQSLRKWAGGRASVEDSFAKFHATVFALRRPAENPFTDLLPAPGQALSPAMFSTSAPDAGSALLARFLDGRRGETADFGAGSGYLSAELLAKSAAVTRLDLYEADWQSLERARVLLAEARVPTGFFWLDVTQEPLPGRYDLIVMNPPFHAGRAADPAIGEAFIAAASKALKPGGRLLMVANRGLPYERALTAGFARFTRLAEEGGYKVIEAVR